jgi:hypothetical protein
VGGEIVKAVDVAAKAPIELNKAVQKKQFAHGV